METDEGLRAIAAECPLSTHCGQSAQRSSNELVGSYEKQLPVEILDKADIRSDEFAWHPSDIPDVIEAARAANLISLGGDLQIRAPSGLWGEPVGVGFGIDVSGHLSWERQVDESAKAALAAFLEFEEKFDFEAIARDAFPALVAEVSNIQDVIFFGWSVCNEAELRDLKSWS